MSSHNNVILTLSDGYIDGLAQDCSNFIANALELLQACTEPSISSSHVIYTIKKGIAFQENIAYILYSIVHQG